jgi:hypothetical protein
MFRLLILAFVCANALDENPKVLEDRTFTEKSPDGQKIQYHYERKEHSDGTTEISVGSVDLMDTAEDMAESMADVPAKVRNYICCCFCSSLN